MGSVRIANHHRGPIIFPRPKTNGVFTPPVCILPGTVETVDEDLWSTFKNTPQIEHYLKTGILSEVKKGGEVPVYEDRTSDPPIPDNLQEGEQVGKEAKASVRKAKGGKDISVQVEA